MVTFDVSARVRELPANFWGAMDLQIAALAQAPGPGVIDVSKGNPDLPTPEHIVAAMQRAVAEPLNHRYPSYAGRKRLRDAVAFRYREDHGVAVDPDAEVAIFHGAHEAIIAAVGALADPHTTVVVPDPGYPIYRSAVTLANADAVTLPLREPHFQPDFDSLRAIEAARVLFLNYPNNPTGVLGSRATFDDALVFSHRTGAAFVHDFAYSSLGFDGQKPLSALTVDTKLDVTVELQTLSKTYSMAGWRVGFAAGNASIISAMKRYQAHAFSTMFGATQDAAAAALEGDQSGVAHLVGVYERRRDLVIAGLQRLGWDVAAPAGTFFVWVRLPGAQDAVQFAQRLRDEQRVAVAPGDGFGESGRGYIRIGLVDDEATLTELIERLAAFTRRN
ncbi:aminotransferase [Microbacterium halimionae]|uniref:Aminotransferase n=1 Tax=Microbacterium halimionae TaxID=1526413 RepID=A0A7W3PM48_9MICO|nr:aminotransferase class I/II-fold pyridoxal phosphate-dependent enzyme [Microbacterium halimionae]MBA8817215.1 aminotransferase [Microbacterium halimionae]NII94665.1 aminotransferase [Microbacterium halimionae]